MCGWGGGTCIAGGHAWVGGASQGACVAGGGGHMWQGACMVGVHGRRHAWQEERPLQRNAWQGACVGGGCAWQEKRPLQRNAFLLFIKLTMNNTATCPSYVTGCVMYLLEIEIEIGIEYTAGIYIF